MPELSLRNIDQISDDVRQEEITFSHLLDDLIDHVCCDVEYEMQKGLDFTNAYLKVRKKLGSKRRLKEIQEETLYEVDSKYRKMKNLMKFSAVTGTIIFGTAALFKIQHWPGAGIMLTIGAVILAFLFMPSALIVLWKETRNSKKILLYVSGFFTGFLFITGILFKVQHWPGAGHILLLAYLTGVILFIPSVLFSRLGVKENEHKKIAYFLGAAGLIFYVSGMLFKIQHWPHAGLLMVFGLIIVGMVAIPVYIWLSWKEEKHIKSAFIFLSVATVLFVVPGALINLSLQNDYQAGYFPNLERQQALCNVRYDLNQSYVNSHKDSANFESLKSFHQTTTEALQLLGNVQAQMILASEGTPGNPAESSAALENTQIGTGINFRLLAQPFHTEMAEIYLYPGTETRELINTILKGYAQQIALLNPDRDTGKYLPLLDPSFLLPDASRTGTPVTLMSGLNSVEVLKNNILTAEAGILKLISEKR